MIPRIRLSRNEKYLLKTACQSSKNVISDTDTNLSPQLFEIVLQSLVDKKLVYGKASSEKGQSFLYLSDYGKDYIAAYPSLRSPIIWKEIAWWVGTVLAIASTILSIYNFCK